MVSSRLEAGGIETKNEVVVVVVVLVLLLLFM